MGETCFWVLEIMASRCFSMLQSGLQTWICNKKQRKAWIGFGCYFSFIIALSLQPNFPRLLKNKREKKKKKSKSWTKKRAMNFSTASWSPNKKSEIQTLCKLELRRYWKKKKRSHQAAWGKKKLLLFLQACFSSNTNSVQNLWKSVSLSKHTKKRELLLYDQGANLLLSCFSSSCKKQITWNTHSGVHLIKDENKSSSSAPLLLVQLQIQNMDKILPSPENTTDWLNRLPTKCKRWKKLFQSYSCIANNPPYLPPSLPSSLKLLLLLKAQTTFPQTQTQNQNKTKPILSSSFPPSLPPSKTQSFH